MSFGTGRDNVKQIKKNKKYLFIFFITLVSPTLLAPYTFKLFQKVARIHYRPHKKAQTRLFSALDDNFFEIEKNTFYRSKQLTAKRLAFYLQKFQIKTVINLRGSHSTQSWWKEEEATVCNQGAHLYNIAMSAQHLPHQKELKQLLFLYDNAPRPILVHCLSGADRTGEAAALWVLDQQKKQKKDALRQLTFKYGHLKFKAPSKCFFINLWQGHSWALNSYNPSKYPQFYPARISI